MVVKSFYLWHEKVVLSCFQMRRQQNLTPFKKKPCQPLLQVPILKRQFNLMELVRQVVVKVGFWCLPYSRAYFRKLPIQPRGQTHRIFNSLIRPKLQVGLEFLEYLMGLLVFYIGKIHILYTCFHCCSCIPHWVKFRLFNSESTIFFAIFQGAAKCFLAYFDVN